MSSLASVQSATSVAKVSFPTSTKISSGEISPWLASEGPLSYSPESPPGRDYFFQYGWVMADILSPKSNRRSHYYFGHGLREDADDLFRFWQTARDGNAKLIYKQNGLVGAEKICAPIAVYDYEDVLGRPHFIFIQHGSYQIIPQEEQPDLREGRITLYRGIGSSTKFKEFLSAVSTEEMERAWRAYADTQARILSDSVVSFNSIHDRAARSETCNLNDRTLISDKIAREHGVETTGNSVSARLWRSHQQCYTLHRRTASFKFGPNYVECETSIDNIRITTFFANEFEVKLLDPRSLKITGTHGCHVVFA